MFSGVGMLIGARIFGVFSSTYSAIGRGEAIGVSVLINTGIVFYGGMFGFVLTFIFICKVWNKKIEYGVIDLVAVCIPLFHFWGRLGCFFAGCCYGMESDSVISITYTNFIGHQIVTASRIPVQLIEAFANLVILVVLSILLSKQKFKDYLIIVYLSTYASIRILLEFLRGDVMRGVWGGISFSQVVSVAILLGCGLFLIKKRNIIRLGA